MRGVIKGWAMPKGRFNQKMQTIILFLGLAKAQIDFDYSHVDPDDYPDWMLESDWSDFLG